MLSFLNNWLHQRIKVWVVCINRKLYDVVSSIFQTFPFFSVLWFYFTILPWFQFCVDVFASFWNPLLQESTDHCESVIQQLTSSCDSLLDTVFIIGRFCRNILTVGFNLVSDAWIIQSCSVISQNSSIG